ncbi:FAD/NAD(P)-binding protein [Luteolibacter arcticus]|uniref:FAD/NAD(P)-binding protein n=1 Tax=Luteolibacter arcticus TaxID=1581411 RepID=A0ABT3GHX5_9BACT|nr:FAD/NAD(P)-binding protein [Luteolibacter arcticus]MCW1923111.1 FAD/NAD(P)-binding protein [Luteolibacter arcticus]
MASDSETSLDAPASPRFDVAIIGAGFSGSMLAVHLSQAESPPRVALIERTPAFGPGLAYGAAAPEHLLNVPAGKMSAFPDRPHHFLEWARTTDPTIGPGAFLPRVVYGKYLQHLVAQAALRTQNLQFINGEAIDVEALPAGGVRIHFAGGGILEANDVILAWGNLPPTTPASADPQGPGDSETRVLQNPWSGQARAALAKPGEVLIIGAGLTCLDLLVTAKKIGRTAPIHVLSRHGLFPQAHRASSPRRSFLDPDQLPKNIRLLFRHVRAEIALAATKGMDWRAVVDSLRPHTQAIWIALPREQRRRFLRHVRSLWETLRHRAAPEIRAVKDELEASGQLIRHSGRLESIQPLPDGVEVIYRPRGSSVAQRLKVGVVINATGPEVNPERGQSQLLKNLIARGLTTPDPLGLGIEVTRLAGEGADPLHTVGSLRKGSLWESTAVPELRVQAAELARQLLAARDATATGATSAAGHLWIFEI